MTIEGGPVSLADAQAAVVHLRDLALRATEHGQDDFALVFLLTADSLDSNVETMELADAVDHD
jgi:hypothetical protein